MKSLSLSLLLAVAGLLVAGGASADPGDEVLKSKGCLNCHAFDKKKMGPAYNDVAAKYKGNKDAQGMLVNKLKEGKGHPKVNGTEDEITAAIKRVLAAM